MLNFSVLTSNPPRFACPATSCAASMRTCCKCIVKESCVRVPLHMRWQAAPDCICAVGVGGKGDVCASCMCWL